MTNNNFEAIRAELEKHYTHVTFVRYDKEFGHSYWTIGEDMEEVVVSDKQELNKIASNVEALAIVKAMELYTYNAHYKVDLFKQCINRGLIKADRKLYKKMTAKQMGDMLLEADGITN